MLIPSSQSYRNLPHGVTCASTRPIQMITKSWWRKLYKRSWNTSWRISRSENDVSTGSNRATRERHHFNFHLGTKCVAHKCGTKSILCQNVGWVKHVCISVCVIKTRKAGECSLFRNSHANRCVHLRTGLTACRTFYFSWQPSVHSYCWAGTLVFEKEDLPWNNWWMSSQANNLD